MALQALEIVRIGILMQTRFLHFCSHTVFFSTGMLFPLFSVTYIIAPQSRFGQTMRKPFIKFICHSASYFTFLCMFRVAFGS